MADFLAQLKEGKKLRQTETVVKKLSVDQFVETEPKEGEDERVRDYFFRAGVDEWYENLKDVTFPSAFVSLEEREALAIRDNWRQLYENKEEREEGEEEENEGDQLITKIKRKENNPTERVPNELQDLVDRIDAAIRENFGLNTKHRKKVFVKLSTRSPKDSFTVFNRALADFQGQLSAEQLMVSATSDSDNNDDEIEGEGEKEKEKEKNETKEKILKTANDRLCVFSDLMIQHSAVESGDEAIRIMLDSFRVYEDIDEAYAEGKESRGSQLNIVIRGWDHRIKSACEFRGFVWNYELTCVGQYWHHLFFPSLQNKNFQEQIATEIQTFYESQLKSSMPVPCAMLDLAYLGSGKVLLVEINPLTDGLGSFPGSTGLFHYEEKVLRGEAPFEFRVCQKPADLPTLLKVMNPTWRAILN